VPALGSKCSKRHRSGCIRLCIHASLCSTGRREQGSFFSRFRHQVVLAPVVAPVNLDSSRLVLLLAADVAAVLGVVGLVLVRRAEQRTGLSLTSTATSVNVIGSDTGAAPGMLVREPTLGLRGRPDYVVEYGAPNERRLYPLEVKPTRRSQRVYEIDEMQVGAYPVALRGTLMPIA